MCCCNRLQMGMQRFNYRTASVQAGPDQSVGVARVSGIVTPESVRGIVADSTLWGQGREVFAHLVHYNSATIAMNLDDLLSSARRAKRADAAQSPPAAFVVSADQLPLFESYTGAMMGLGFHMAAFTSSAEGRRWAAQQALVREHWRAQRAGLRRSAP